MFVSLFTKSNDMKKLLFLILSGSVAIASCAQININKTKKQVKKSANQAVKDAENIYNDVSGQKKPLSNDEVIKGLKEALSVGTNNSSSSASKTDGYFGNPMIKIPFPDEAIKVKNTLEDLGMQEQVNKFILTMNRAAEEAAKESAPIFLNAITGMSIADGFGILKGEDNAATQYLQNNTSAELKSAFSPKVKSAIDKVEVTKYWNPLMTTYNKIPGVQKVNPNLEEYITNRAINGLFILLAEEEMKIRKDPAARVTDILKRVFGS
jgi:hypothetical protein